MYCEYSEAVHASVCVRETATKIVLTSKVHFSSVYLAKLESTFFGILIIFFRNQKKRFSKEGCKILSKSVMKNIKGRFISAIIIQK